VSCNDEETVTDWFWLAVVEIGTADAANEIGVQQLGRAKKQLQRRHLEANNKKH
jgi:hypothetical protein